MFRPTSEDVLGGSVELHNSADGAAVKDATYGALPELDWLQVSPAIAYEPAVAADGLRGAVGRLLGAGPDDTVHFPCSM